MDFFKILKGGVGLGMSNFDRLFAEKHGGGAWQLTTLTGTLPLTFESKGGSLTDYKLYGTAEGAGVQTESGEPTGYKLPMAVESGEESTTTPIYIGDSKLGEEEYVDYESGKVYKRTEQLFNKDAKDTAKGYVAKAYLASNGTVTSGAGFIISEYIQIDQAENYTIDGPGLSAMTNASLCFYDSNKSFISGEKYNNRAPITVASPIGARYARITVQAYRIEFYCFSKGNTATQKKYLRPTDSPVALPELSTYQGENTLSCSETLGEISITGYIKGE